MQFQVRHPDIPTEGSLVPIHFKFQDPDAVTVYVAGTFNQWRPQATPLVRRSGGYWGRFTALSAGTYEYCLVVDEDWILDPRNPASVANPFGGRNSVLTVSHSTGEAELVKAAFLPLEPPIGVGKGGAELSAARTGTETPLLVARPAELADSTVLHRINKLDSSDLRL